jgi:DNA polymerase III delta subunit
VVPYGGVLLSRLCYHGSDVIVILTGTNNFGLRAELQKLVAMFVAENDDMALERLDGDDASFERIQEALQSLPFLSDKKMVVLQAPGIARNNRLDYC